MSQPIKTLRQIVMENAVMLLAQHPELKGELRSLVIKTFEKGLLIAACQFSYGSKKKLTSMLGISYETVKKKIKEHGIRYLGTLPQDQSYLVLINTAYDLNNHTPLNEIERAVIHWVFLYCLSISPIKYLYDAAIAEIEIPLIAVGFKEGATRTGAAKVLGLSRATLCKKLAWYGIKSR